MRDHSDLVKSFPGIEEGLSPRPWQVATHLHPSPPHFPDLSGSLGLCRESKLQEFSLQQRVGLYDEAFKLLLLQLLRLLLVLHTPQRAGGREQHRARLSEGLPRFCD